MIPQGPTDRELLVSALEVVLRLALWVLAIACILVCGMLLVGAL